MQKIKLHPTVSTQKTLSKTKIKTFLSYICLKNIRKSIYNEITTPIKTPKKNHNNIQNFKMWIFFWMSTQQFVRPIFE